MGGDGFPTPSGHPIAGLGSSLEVIGDIDLWITTFGRGARSAVTAAIASDPWCPFADGVAATVMGTFGLDPNRLIMPSATTSRGSSPKRGLPSYASARRAPTRPKRRLGSPPTGARIARCATDLAR